MTRLRRDARVRAGLLVGKPAASENVAERGLNRARPRGIYRLEHGVIAGLTHGLSVLEQKVEQ
jgi:hypothetical protein